MAARMSRNRLMILGTVLAGLTCLLPAYSATTAASGATVRAESAPLPDPVDELSAQLLSAHFHVSIEAARTQMARQNDILDLNERLEEATPQSWAGSRIDQANGGRLIVWTTNIAAALSALSKESSPLRDLVDVRPVQYTYASLDALATAVLATLKTAGVDYREAYAAPDPSTNSVLLKLASASQLEALGVTDAQAFYAAAARVVEPFSPVIIDDGGFANTPAACHGAYEICDVPLRGGIEIESYNSGVLCTGGFTVRSRSTHTPFLLTAGHCGTNDWYTAFSTGRLTAIGSTVPGYIHPPQGDLKDDEQIMTIDNPSDTVGWQMTTQSGVYVVNSGGTRPTTRVEYYPITAVGSNCTAATCSGPNIVPQDSYLCWTGASWQTDCGRFHMTHVNTATLNTDDWGTCGGDSGGPVYAGHRGYGIVISTPGNVRYNALRYFAPVSVVCTSQGYGTDGMAYQLLNTSLDALNMELIP